jgi:trigger factor
LKISVDKPTSYQRVLKVEVPSEVVNEEIESIYSKMAKTATHPGFRKGKVPRKILEKKFGKSIRLEAVETTVASSARKALEEEELVPLTDPDFEEVNFEDEGPLSFQATIEVTPDIELAEYKGIDLKQPKSEVTEDDIDKVLERLRISNAKYAPAERPVEKGDFIVLDFEAFEDGKPMKDAKGENFPLEVGSGAFGEDFETQLVGVEKDEKKEVTVTYPEDYRAKELAGKDVRFDVMVKDIKERELPELNDDFAKDLGEHDTLDALKEHIRERLEKDMERRIEQFMRDQAVAKLVTDSNLEVPPKLRDKVASSVFEEEVNRMAQQGASQESLIEQRDKLIEYAEAQAERQLKASFITDEIAKRENLAVSDEELEKSLEEISKESEQEESRIREYFKSERVRERYREQLRVKKILDFIVDNAKIEEVDELESEEEQTQIPEEEEGDS